MQCRIDFIGCREGFANIVHDARVGGRVGWAGCAYRCLINHNRFGVLVEKSLVNERTFARTRYARHNGQDADWNIDTDIL